MTWMQKYAVDFFQVSVYTGTFLLFDFQIWDKQSITEYFGYMPKGTKSLCITDCISMYLQVAKSS